MPLFRRDPEVFHVVQNGFVEEGGSGVGDQVNRGLAFDGIVESAGSCDVGDDAEVKILQAGGGILGAYLVGFA